MPPRLTTQQRKILGNIKFLGSEMLYLQSLCELTMQEIYARGFGKITGPEKHINFDKASVSRIGRRLASLENFFNNAKLQNKNRISEAIAEAQKLSVSHKQIYETLFSSNPVVTIDDLKVYLHESPTKRVAEQMLREQIGGAAEEKPIYWGNI